MSARAISVLVCDFAQVREGLLTVVSAGITRVYRDSLPAPAMVSVAVMVEVSPEDPPLTHEVRVVVSFVETGKQIGEAVMGFQANLIGEYAKPGETQQVPLPLNLAGLKIEQYGQYDIKVVVDNEPAEIRSLWVVDPSEKP